MKIADQVKSLNFPFGQYVVVGGAAMEARGMVRKSGDINIAVLPALFSDLRAKDWNMSEFDGRVHLMRGVYEVLPDVRIRGYDSTVEDLIESAETIEGVPFVDLIELRNFKQARGTQKDKNDIVLVDDYLLHHSK